MGPSYVLMDIPNNGGGLGADTCGPFLLMEEQWRAPLIVETRSRVPDKPWEFLIIDS